MFNKTENKKLKKINKIMHNNKKVMNKSGFQLKTHPKINKSSRILFNKNYNLMNQVFLNKFRL